MSKLALAIAAFIAMGYLGYPSGKLYRNDEITRTRLDAIAFSDLRLVEGRLTRGSTLLASIVDDGVPRGLASMVSTSLNSIYDTRRCRPGDKYRLYFSREDSLECVIFEPQGLEKYMLFRDGQGFVPQVVSKPIRNYVKKVSGVLWTSLWDAVQQENEDPELAMRFSDVFAWELDFLTEPRPGDRFEFLVEVFESPDDEKIIGYGDIRAAKYVTSDRELVAVHYCDPEGNCGYYDPQGRSLEKTLLRSPLNYRRISSGFTRSRLHPIYKVYRPHNGIDYTAPTGTPVVSAGDGVVSFVGWRRGFGRYIEIRHSGGFVTSYGHLSRYARGLKRGDQVSQNQVIGYVGSSGDSTGPHLDYRIRHNGRYVNPLTVELPSSNPVPEEYLPNFYECSGQLLLALETYRMMSPPVSAVYAELPQPLPAGISTIPD